MMCTSGGLLAASNFKPLRRFMIRLICYVIIGYMGVILVLLALENYFLFHPLQATRDWLPPPIQPVQDIELHTPDGTLIHGWWCPVEHAAMTVLYCHGNAGNLSHRGALIGEWQQFLRASVFIFDYPGYGRSEGKPSEAGCYAAGTASYDWLINKQNVDADRLVIYGGSLGGAIAVELASHRPHMALVLNSTFTSIPDMAQKQFPWLPGRWLVRNRFDSLAKIASCKGPVFIAHGDADRLVPYSQGRKLFAAASEPKQFLTVPGSDHNNPPGPEFFTTLGQFLKNSFPVSQNQHKTT